MRFSLNLFDNNQSRMNTKFYQMSILSPNLKGHNDLSELWQSQNKSSQSLWKRLRYL